MSWELAMSHYMAKVGRKRADGPLRAKMRASSRLALMIDATVLFAFDFFLSLASFLACLLL